MKENKSQVIEDIIELVGLGFKFEDACKLAKEMNAYDIRKASKFS